MWGPTRQGSSPLSPFTGCFTLSSPATAAEGLCQYKSGYLHWVRKKPISCTNEHRLNTLFISDVPIAANTRWGHPVISLSLLLSYMMGLHRCNIWVIARLFKLFWKHYWNAGCRFLFVFLQCCFRGISEIQIANPGDSHPVMLCTFGRFEGFGRMISDTQRQQCVRKRGNCRFKPRYLNFEWKPVCHSVILLPNNDVDIACLPIRIWLCIL